MKVFSAIALVILLSSNLIANGLFDDTTRIKLGNKIICFINQGADEFDWDEGFEVDEKRRKIKPGANFSLGTLGYSVKHPVSLLNPTHIMAINYSNSRSTEFNFLLKGIGTKNKRVYVHPGIGLNYNSWSFINNISILPNDDSTIFLMDSVIINNKYNLKSNYIQLPILFGFRISNKPFGLQFGAIGSYLIRSYVKQVYKENDVRFKNAICHNFNLSPMRIDVVAKLSYKSIGIFLRHSLTSHFRLNSAKELFPFSIGLSIGGF